MASYGYAWVSTIDQDDNSRGASKAAGCTVIWAEKKSGSNEQHRKELNKLLELLCDGESLVVTGRSIGKISGDVQDIVRLLKQEGATLKATG